MPANNVSPPNGGITFPCCIVNIGGARLNVMSVCHISIFDGLSFVLSRICTSDVRNHFVCRMASSANRTAKARCCCGVIHDREEQHLMLEQRSADRRTTKSTRSRPPPEHRARTRRARQRLFQSSTTALYRFWIS
jgi:hypothetical protein